MRTTRVIQWAAVLVILSLAGVVQASISYSVDGWGPTSYPGPHAPPPGAPHASYPGDSVGLSASDGTLAVGLNTGIKIGTLSWVANWTYNGTDDDLLNDGPPPKDWPELQFVVNTVRGIAFGGASAGSLSQTVRLRTNWDMDYLLLYDEAMQEFSAVVNGEIYQIDVTPKGLAEVELNNWSGAPPWNQNQRDVLADFFVTDVGPVPEPATMIVWSLLGAASWLGMRVARRGRRVGRQGWSDENRAAIVGIIDRSR